MIHLINLKDLEYMSASRKIEKSEWERVLTVMNRYHRNDGWVDLPQGDDKWKLEFFDSNPRFNSVNAIAISRCEVEQIIRTY